MSACSQNATWLAIFLPRLSTDRLIRSGRAPEDKPVAVYAKEANAFAVTGVNAGAAAVGVRRGMALADARAIHPSLIAIAAEPEEDAHALDAIAAWCERFTPVAVLDPPDGVFLDIAGCEHLFGGAQALCTDIVSRLHAQGFGARIALGETLGAAWALARYGGASQQEIAPLPVEALRLDEAAASLLQRLGLKTIGQAAAAPRSAFAARAGERALLRLDQAYGRAPEPFSPRRPAPPIFSLRRFLEPIFTADAVLIATESLCQDVAAQLDQRGAGARRCALHLFGVDGRDRMIEIGASQPERSAKALLRLFREKVNRAAETMDAEFGIEAARLDVVQMERMGDATPVLTGEDAPANAAAIAALLDVLSARLGSKQVLRPRLNGAHDPMKAGGWRRASAPQPHPHASLAPPDGVPRRPLSLFARPCPIDAIATVPDGPPIRFRWRRVLREIVRAEGPERIEGDWLTQSPARDYYRVEDKSGRRYWLCREGAYGGAEPPRWFVCGLFA